MPELPEVEVIRRDLEKEIIGRKIKRVEVRSTKNAMRIIRRHRKRKDFEDGLAGAKIMKVDRLGKYLLVGLDNGSVLVIHLGMSGQLVLSKSSAPVANHTHVILEFTVGGQLRYVDPRTFGEMFLSAKDDVGRIKELQDLGIDPLVDALTWQYFSETLAHRKAKMKGILMDQKFISGIGNIYSDEILFLAGIRFDRISDTLSSSEVRRLYRAIQEILQEAVRYRGTSADDEQYRDLYGLPGEFQQFLKVYQREGLACRRCRTPIDRTRWSNRSTYFCPQCQV
ncbi:MAG TPA: bifunctional DNA-formamidopyrimidine glycosylase/DNA-(apurinic or apyrimidinic site) lyase [Actinomycetota bacterium]|nr:bifunctional DNA-formamidopyrimidine glycosylase/DNA-(apurinic or apyrimidinic site) lyase [Actinomycetota bacterium]